MRTTTEIAYAKINLYLDVLGKRNDGYHDVLTLMHAVTLADTLEISVKESTETSISINVENVDFLCSEEDNLVYKAIDLYLKSSRLTAEITVKLVKNIPTMAGLGGGSSDAAAALRAMNNLFGNIFSSIQLEALAAQLGSDVPFFISNISALCSGRGEILTPMPHLKSYFVLIVEGKEPSPTGKAFRIIDEDKTRLSSSRETPSFEHFSMSEVYNVFERPMLTYCPSVAYHLAVLKNTNPLCASMSGSGSSVYAIYETKAEAIDAADSLPTSKTHICQLKA